MTNAELGLDQQALIDTKPTSYDPDDMFFGKGGITASGHSTSNPSTEPIIDSAEHEAHRILNTLGADALAVFLGADVHH